MSLRSWLLRRLTPVVATSAEPEDDGGFVIAGPEPGIPEGSSWSVSAADVGLDLSALARMYAEGAIEHLSVRPGMATATDNNPLARPQSNPPPLLPLYGDGLLPQAMRKNRVLQNWTLPIPLAPMLPVLEIITARVNRSLVSLGYYLTDGVVGPAIDTLAEFPLNRGFDLEVVYNSEDLPTWFDPDWLDADALVDAYGNSRVTVAVAEWIAAQCEQLAEDLNLTYHMVDLQKEAYVHGDGFLYRVDDVPNQGYTSDHTRVFPENTIVDLQALNPTAVWIVKDSVGLVERAQVVGQPGITREELVLDKLVHLKHKGSAYSTYGFPLTQRAFKDLTLKDAYLDAGTAWGKRYALPVRMLKYGVLVRTGQAAGPIATAKMRAEAKKAVESYDPTTGTTIVAPFHWEYQFVGADGATAMVISGEVMEANKRIMGALGIPSAFLYGDWTNYATARIQYSALMHRLKGSQTQLARLLERHVFAVFCQIRGYVDNLGQPIRVKVRWKRAHLEDDASYMQFIAEIGKSMPQLLSPQTLRESLGFDDAIEEQRFAEERDRQLRISQQQQAAGVPPQAPASETPATDRTNPPQVAPEEDPEDRERQRVQRQAEARLRTGLAAAERRLADDVRCAAAKLGLDAPRTGVPPAYDGKVVRAVVLRLKQERALRDAYRLRLEQLAAVA